MAGFFAVSVPTLQAAVHILASLGLVRVSRGVGTFVARPRHGAAVLNHAWLKITPGELAIMRFAIDTQVPVIVARLVRTKPIIRLPATLSDIAFWAHDRAGYRSDFPEQFLRADVRFHLEVARSVRGAEVTADLYQRIMERLLPHLMAVADVQAADPTLDELHRALASTILDGQPVAAARLARALARRELESLNESLR